MTVKLLSLEREERKWFLNVYSKASHNIQLYLAKCKRIPPNRLDTRTRQM